MNMQTLAKELLSSKKSPLFISGVVLSAAFGILASLELIFLSPTSALGWLGLISGLIVYNFCFALAIGDTKNWDSTITHNG